MDNNMLKAGYVDSSQEVLPLFLYPNYIMRRFGDASSALNQGNALAATEQYYDCIEPILA